MKCNNLIQSIKVIHNKLSYFLEKCFRGDPICIRLLKKVQKWIFVSPVVPLFPVVAMLLIYVFPRFEDQFLRNRQDMTKVAVQVAIQILHIYDRDVKNGKLSLHAAQDLVKEELRKLRYNGNEYFWIHDINSIILMHPFSLSLEGTDASEIQDQNGKKVFAEMVTLCKTFDRGFVNYIWPKPEFSKPIPKISYVQIFRPWGWIIGSGVYIDDVKSESLSFKLRIFSVITVFFLFSSIVQISGNRKKDEIND